MSLKPVLIMAGGTGGHVYPAMAIADYISAKGIPLFWLGTEKGLEARVVPPRGYSLITIQVGGLRGKGIYRWLVAPFTLLRALLESIRIMREIRPSVVLGMGGFVSGPGGIAAWLMRVPLCIHEQNAVAGLTNRILTPLARAVMCAFPDVFPSRIHALVTGNPLRASFNDLPVPMDRNPGAQSGRLKILVLGGSQGARKLNTIIPRALLKLQGNVDAIIRHQCGESMLEETRTNYQHIPLDYTVVPFIEDMKEAYLWADLVICRAGALTVAELSAVGVASVLVPFPYAVDDHQTVNARYLVEGDAAICIQERDLDETRLATIITDFYNSRQKLLSMASNARKLAKTNATELVAERCLEVACA